MYFAPALQPHKESMIMLGWLIDTADAPEFLRMCSQFSFEGAVEDGGFLLRLDRGEDKR